MKAIKVANLHHSYKKKRRHDSRVRIGYHSRLDMTLEILYSTPKDHPDS